MAVRLSTKGQLVIPKAIRDAMGLEAGTEFDIRVESEGRITLVPLLDSPIAGLYGKYGDVDFLSEMEAEHREEVAREEVASDEAARS